MSDNVTPKNDYSDVPVPETHCIPLPSDEGSSSNNPNQTVPQKITTSKKGVENAKKRLRAFSIQKKTPILPKALAKTSVSGTTVVIGKLSSSKVTPKVQDPDAEIRRLPKPPKPAESYTDLQKKTLAEIEDMKRKMELVELGIPLGLICPPPNSDTAMPSKAMPPIKTFLANYRDNIFNKAKVNVNTYTRPLIPTINFCSARHQPAKVDELISEAKKARAAGKKFKFDYETILPDYENPFQRKKEEEKPDTKKFDIYRSRSHHRWSNVDKNQDKDRKRRDKSRESKRSEIKKEYRDKDPKENESKGTDKSKHRVKEKGTSERRDEKKTNEKDIIETDVNLSDYLVCDSWSLDTEEKTSSPKPDESTSRKEEVQLKVNDPMEIVRESLPSKKKIDAKVKSPIRKDSNQVDTFKKLQPVKDEFKYVIDLEHDGGMLDIFDDTCDFSMYSKPKSTPKKNSSYKQSKNSTDSFDAHEVSNDNSQNSSIDEYSSKANSKFLESVILEIKQEDMSDETSQDKKFLVEYELSPEKDSPEITEKSYHKAGSITPELDDSYYDMCSSQRSDYSESTMRSIESGYKSTESGYKSNDSYKICESIEKEYVDYHQNDARMSKATVESLEMWSFVLKICQPLLFRHDSNTCYRSTMTIPKLWYTENPKLCSCVNDRIVVYDELEACKMSLVDRVYGCDQIPETACPKSRTWYPRINQCLLDNVSTLTTNWETDESSQNSEMTNYQNPNLKLDIHRDEMALDREYKKFMEALLPEVSESKIKNVSDAMDDGSKATLGQEMKSKIRKGITEHDKAEETKGETKRKRKKSMKVSSDDWSQESDPKKEKSHKKMKEKVREKRKKKDSISSDSDSSIIEENVNKHKKSKRKDSKHRSKPEKKRHSDKKHSHKKDKEKRKRKKVKENEDHDFDSDSEEELKKHKKNKEKKKAKKKEVKRKKKRQKKKKSRTKSTSTSETNTSDDSTSSETSSTSSSITTSDSESEKENLRIRRRKQKKERRQIKRRHASESRRYSDEFDVNILNNIKKERLTDDEKMQDFSPRRQTTVVPRHEIINIKELHNDIVAQNLIHIKQEVVEEETKLEELPEPVPTVSNELNITESVEPDISADDKDKKPPEDIVVPEDDSEQFQQTENIELQHIPIPEEIPLPTADYKETHVEVLSAIDNDNNYAQNDNIIYPKIQIMNYAEELNEADAVDENIYDYEQCYSQYGHVHYQEENDVQMQDNEEESRPIETLVSASGSRGEIKCDWRPEQRAPRAPPARPSRWGLKPNDSHMSSSDGSGYDENRVYPIRSVLDSDAVESQTFRIQTISSIRRSEDTASPVVGYDEAYEDTYGAADRLAYGDCFGSPVPPPAPPPPPGPPPLARTSRSLDARIDRALRETVLGLVTKEAIDETNDDQTSREKGILASKSGSRAAKRVSFADGYAPGQDSDNEPPPKKKKKKTALRGSPWPCPATHPDHVPLWDALPPPDPPPGSPPPRAARRRTAPHMTAMPLQPLKVA